MGACRAHRKEPIVSVGILTADSVDIELHGGYVLHGPDGADEHLADCLCQASTSDGRIHLHPSLCGSEDRHSRHCESQSDVAISRSQEADMVRRDCHSRLQRLRNDAGPQGPLTSHSSLLTLVPESPESFFTIKDVTIGIGFHWQKKENQSFAGSLRLLCNEDRIVVINDINIEEYLRSVISSEMSPTAPLEFLKAHAVISRSWLLSQIEGRGKRTGSAGGMVDTPELLVRWQDREDHELFDVCADDHCQRYQGITKACTPQAAEAVGATAGLVLTSGGKICDARFSKCCGGVSELFSSCWEDEDYPYLQPVEDPFCNMEGSPALRRLMNDFDLPTADFYRWRVEYSQQELSRLIRERSGVDYGDIISLEAVKRGPSGRIVLLKITGSRLTRTIGKELEIRRTLSNSCLFSSAFDVEMADYQGFVPGRFILHGHGWGHGVGLCQIGAAAMGLKGHDFREILSFYYKGAQISARYAGAYLRGEE